MAGEAGGALDAGSVDGDEAVGKIVEGLLDGVVGGGGAVLEHESAAIGVEAEFGEDVGEQEEHFIFFEVDAFAGFEIFHAGFEAAGELAGAE